MACGTGHPFTPAVGMLSSFRSFLSLLGTCVSIAASAGRADSLESALERNDLGSAEEELERVARDWEAAWKQSGKEEDAREFGRTLHALGIIERQTAKAEEALPHLK